MCALVHHATQLVAPRSATCEVLYAQTHDKRERSRTGLVSRRVCKALTREMTILQQGRDFHNNEMPTTTRHARQREEPWARALAWGGSRCADLVLGSGQADPGQPSGRPLHRAAEPRRGRLRAQPGVPQGESATAWCHEDMGEANVTASPQLKNKALPP